MSVSAPGAAPPAVGKIGNTVKAKTAPVIAVKETLSGVLGAVSASAKLVPIMSQKPPKLAIVQL